MNIETARNVEISILMMTYNHEQYVGKALDSILMQKISVPYEIIIIDDASIDRTPQILKMYKKKYPQTISLYLRKVNSCHPTQNGYFLLSKAKGKYYAAIEGDDYWIDDLKLQKQYEFLTSHPQYSACMTDLIVVDKNDNRLECQVFEKKENHVYTLEDFKNLRGPGMNVTFFAKNYFNKREYSIIYKADRIMGDVTTYMLSLLKGNIYQLDDVMAAYRYVCIEGKNNFNSIQKDNIYRDYMQIRYWFRLENFMKKYDEKFSFLSMPDAIKKIALEYPANIGFRLMVLSKNRRKYIPIYLAHKYLKDSNYMLDGGKDRRHYKKWSWNAFIKEQKPIILFGAGAVAEEYLNKYGWKENIAFLVDNDRKKQNTSFKGYLVKAPEEILKYKDKIKILITNKDHETDIESQLQEMGIKEYYCYCTMQGRRLKNLVSKKIMQRCISVKI